MNGRKKGKRDGGSKMEKGKNEVDKRKRKEGN